MGPVRGYRKRKKVEPNASASELTQEGSEDWWNVFSKRIAGLPSSSNGLDTFEYVFKMSRKTFNYICSLVKEYMMGKATKTFMFSNGKPMSLNEQVGVALRRLSSGDSLIAIGESFGINQSTVSQVTWHFVEAMEETGLHHLCWPSTEQEMADIKAKFENIRGLPNCCGAIDTTHITMLVSSSDTSNDVWLDHEKKYSMVLQVIVDPAMRFRDVVTGWPGKMNNFNVLHSSTFFKLCQEGKRLNGIKLKLSEGTELGEYIIGDLGFPLLPWLVTPYHGKELPESKVEYNKRLLATHMVARKALGRLKETWRIIHGSMWRPDKNKLPRIILVCCILHNIIIDMEYKVAKGWAPSHHHDKGYKQEVCEVADKMALILRDKLSLSLSGGLMP